MSEPKFTGGEWKVRKFYRYDKTIFIDPCNIRIDNDDVEHDEAIANANGVSAMKELYASLQEFKSLFSSGVYGIARNDKEMIGFGEQMVIGNMFQRADMALAKARGEST